MLAALTGVVSAACGADSDSDSRSGSTGPVSPTQEATAASTNSEETSATGGVLPAGAGVKGVTDTVIKVGMIGQDASAASSQGAEAGVNIEVDPGAEAQASIDAVVDYINATGGIAGRQVEVAFFDYNEEIVTDQTLRQQETQAACTSWTEDAEVFLFSSDGLSVDSLIINCAVDSKTPLVAASPAQAYPSEDDLTEVGPYFYAPLGFTAERRDRQLVEFLDAQGFFTDDAVVGIVGAASPGIEKGIENGLKPALAEHGLKAAVTILFPDPFDSPWSNYVLQLQDAGVTHVVMASSSTGLLASLFMMNGAEEQGYRPQWGLASDNSPSDHPGAEVAPAQLQNMLAMGWFPWNDVLQREPVSENTELCNKVMLDAGLTDHPYNYASCEFFFFLRAAFEQADEVSPEGFAEGVERLGTSYPSVYAMNGLTEFGPGRHDGAGNVVRAVVYDASCGCMQYEGDPIELSS